MIRNYGESFKLDMNFSEMFLKTIPVGEVKKRLGKYGLFRSELKKFINNAELSAR